MVGNVTVIDNSDAVNKIYDTIRKAYLSNLKNVRSGAYTTTQDFLNQLRDTIGYKFSEMRIACTKVHHGRKVDVAFMGQMVDDLLARNAERSLTRDVDYRSLSNDQSRLMGANSNLRKQASAYLFNYPIIIPYDSHINIFNGNRMECDDYNTDFDFGAAGTWEFYIK